MAALDQEKGCDLAYAVAMLQQLIQGMCAKPTVKAYKHKVISADYNVSFFFVLFFNILPFIVLLNVMKYVYRKMRGIVH